MSEAITGFTLHDAKSLRDETRGHSAAASAKKRRIRHHNEKIEYGIYFAIAYPFFLMGTILHRLVPTREKLSVINETHGSIFSDAAETAHSVLPWMFMGR